MGSQRVGHDWVTFTSLHCQCRGHKFDPWSRKTPHTTEQLSPWTTSYWAKTPQSSCSATREATAMRSLRIATRESPEKQWRPRTAKNYLITKEKKNTDCTSMGLQRVRHNWMTFTFHGSFIFRFLRNLHNVFTVAAPIYIPINSIGRFPFLHILIYICYLCSFWW